MENEHITPEQPSSTIYDKVSTTIQQLFSTLKNIGTAIHEINKQKHLTKAQKAHIQKIRNIHHQKKRHHTSFIHKSHD